MNRTRATNARIVSVQLLFERLLGNRQWELRNLRGRPASYHVIATGGWVFAHSRDGAAARHAVYRAMELERMSAQPILAFQSRSPGRGILYLVLAFIPVVNLACLETAIACGVRGNLVAVTSRNFITAISIVLGIIGGAISGLANLVGTHP